jgi:hypothetical protein
MNGSEAAQEFLRNVASKHFVCLTYRCRLPETPIEDAKMYFASCFVVEIEQHWLLVTAGHVISDIQETIAKGAIYSDFSLHDKLAGNRFPLPVPIPFDANDWAVIDGGPDGGDYAAAVIPNLIAKNLLAGGIRPVEESVLGSPPFDQYPHWLLTGIPHESYAFANNRHTLALTVVPLAPSPAPENATVTSGDAKIFGKMLSQPTLDTVNVTDVRGMSGGPVFGVRGVDGQARYWLIGLQSSWYEDARIVCFCPVQPFFAAIKEAIQMALADPSLLEAATPSTGCNV